ncbi:hypothetical protein HON58_04030 [Candidatus Peregrinibacteria bacterium]|jgi:hypothetical protein|nr:hypothetical protein [Candidatus Peregrinibacteria bacterium]
MGKADQQDPLDNIEELLGAESHEKMGSLLELHGQLDEIDAQNRDLYESTLATYDSLMEAIVAKLRDKETPGPLKGKYVQMRRALDERRQAFRERFPEFVAEEESRKAQERLKAKSAPILKSLEESTLISDEENKLFLRYWKELPPDQQERYINHLKGALKNKDQAGVITGFRGMLFELSRRVILTRQQLEEVGGYPEPIYVEYIGYDKKNPQVNKPPVKLFKPNRKNKEGDIQNDVTGVLRDGKPYVYETKAYPRRRFGAEYGAGESAANRNQLLKYQQAINDGSIAGASVEIQGRIDTEFLNWAIGTGLTHEGAIPDVEIIYSMPLPSGREYRFVLKRGRGKGLRFENERSDYTIDDKIVIRGLAQSVRDKSVIGVMTDVNIEIDEDSPLVTAEHIAHPDQITDPEIFEAYNQLRLESIWERLEDKAIDPSVHDKVAAYDERVTRDYVMQMLTDFEIMLNENPELKALKWAYVVEESQYDEVVDRVMEDVERIKEYELARKSSKKERRNKVVRDIQGYKGPAEGYVLDVEHILMDALQNVTKTGEDQKPRSYSDISRFMNLRELKGRLADEDRSYLEITTYDPTRDSHDSKVISGIEDREEQARLIGEYERTIEIENLKRAEARLQKLLKKYQQLHKVGKENRDEEQDSEYRDLQKQLSGYNSGLNNRLNHQKSRLNALLEAKEEELRPLQNAMKDVRGYIESTGIGLDSRAAREQVIEKLRDTSAKYRAAARPIKQEILQTYREIFARDWESFAIREIAREEANLMKMIYVVTPEGEVIVEEEGIRGATDNSRAAHSELAQGRNIYAAGELAFEKIDGEWVLTEINSGSGHYRPSQDTLEYGKAVICEQLGVDPKDARLNVRNCIFRGIDIDGLPLDYR